MGCWNGTCAMTKLPIFHGDRVVCWFIVETQGYSRGDATNFCYPHDRYQLIALPFRAEYNDYGGVENIDEADQDIVNLLIESIRTGLVEIEPGDNEYHDIAVKKDSLTFDLALEAIHEGRLSVVGYQNEKSVGMIMILESVFDKMIADYRWEDYSWPNGYNSASVVTIKKHDLDESAASIKAAVEEDTSDPNNFFWEKIDSMARNLYGLNRLLRGLIQNEIPLEHPLFQKVFYALARTQVLTSFAYDLRMHFGPSCGAGSQQGDLEPYETLISAMQAAIKNRKDEIDSW
jgi:hypothetical protein